MVIKSEALAQLMAPPRLLKQVRIHLVETARPVLESMIHAVTGIPVVSRHHDVRSVTGEGVVLFTLAELPLFRESRKQD